jgi:hypothetical protein
MGMAAPGFSAFKTQYGSLLEPPNANPSGFIGPDNADMMKRIASVQRYIQTLRELEKADPTLFMNVACLNEGEFWEILESFRRQR